jgi:hypothetical protein
MATKVEDSGMPGPGSVTLEAANSPATIPTPVSAGHPGLAQTPSPSTSNSHNVGSTSKRPPRKSTLTQQQKNQKRQRATQDQLTTLEMEFNKNPTPTANVRERIAEEINMTERSVQIWFQNRYGLAPTPFFRIGLISDPDVPRLRLSRRRVWRQARTSTRSQSRCAPTSLCRPWNLAKASEQVSWAVV